MKYFILFVVFISLAFITKAQSNINPHYNLEQKRLLDSLRNAHKLSTIMIQPTPLLVYNTPTALLPNEGEKIGMSGEDTIYRMKTDNMNLLKPNQNTTSIPNSATGKIFMVPPAKKKP